MRCICLTISAIEYVTTTLSFSLINPCNDSIFCNSSGSLTSPSTRTLKSSVPLISSSIKSILSRISVPGLKKLARFTSTVILYNPEKPIKTNNTPIPNTYLGYFITIVAILLINFSNGLALIIALDCLSHFFRLITDGSINELISHAHAIPTEMDTPYPTRGSRGEEVIVKNAAIVVKLVKKIGVNNDSMLDATAFLTSFSFLISRKNFVITWTPSELAIVSNIIGIDVFNIANKNLSEPVNL